MRVRHPVRTAALGLLVVALLLAAVAGAGALYLQHRLTSHIARIDGVFDGLEHRPSRPDHGPAAQAMNILLMGSDRRSEVGTTGRDARAPEWVPGAQRSDTLMLLHVDADRRGATLVSIPRDSWVEIPGHGWSKVNAAFSWGGPSLAVATVERLTDVRIDHVAVVDWDGFRELTDLVGGVTVDVPRTVTDSAHGVTWRAGRHTLDGAQALMYVRQRYGLPGGDLDRVRRQQAFLRALLTQAWTGEVRSDPRAAYRFLETVTEHLSVDAQWSVSDMRSLLLSVRGLDTADVHYLTAPVRGFGYEGSQSVVYLDRARGGPLWRAVRQDRVGGWLARHRDADIADVVE